MKTTFRTMSFEEGDFAKLREHHNFLFVGDQIGIIAELDGKIIGAALGDTFQAGSCWMHIWVGDPQAFRDGLLEVAAQYAFSTGIKKVLARLLSDNHKVIKCAERGGFKFLFKIEDGADTGVDYLFYEMNRDECPYLPENK